MKSLSESFLKKSLGSFLEGYIVTCREISIFLSMVTSF